MWTSETEPEPKIKQALALLADTFKLAEETANACFVDQTDLRGLAAMFLARTRQSLQSVGLLASNGLIGDAMTVGRTVVEMAIDFSYIALQPADRIKMFMDYDHVSKFKLATAVDTLHGGKVSPATMSVLRQRRDKATQDNPDAVMNWAGESIKKRAKDSGQERTYDLVYADMCMASHSCYATLEYALVDLDTSPKVRFGPGKASSRPMALVGGAMLILIAKAVDACGLDKALGVRSNEIADRLQSL